MNWNELVEVVVSKMTPEQREEEVAVFVFCNGNLEMLNAVSCVGQDIALDSHCEDFNEIDNPQAKLGFPFLVCGINDMDWTPTK